VTPKLFPSSGARLRLDPNFARPIRPGECPTPTLASLACQRKNLKKAYEMRARVSERERLRISGKLLCLVTGELEKEAQTYQLWIQSYPHDAIPHGT